MGKGTYFFDGLAMFRNASKIKSRIRKLCNGKEKAGDITKRIYKDRGSAFRKRQDGTTRICRTIKTGVI